MTEEALISLALIIAVGISVQWVAWRLKIPSILLLLMAGLIAGPVTNILHIDALFGELLFPVVSLAVAIILFEGGLSLRLADLREVGSVVRNLVTIGVVMTWLISAGAAYVLLGLSPSLSLLMGAIIVVTGPTVIIPLLKQIRPMPRVASILRWEGIIIDPVGAILTVLVFEEILAGSTQPGIGQAIISLAKTLLIGGGIGWLSARLMIELYARYWVPDSLQNPFTLMLVIGAFALSNHFQAESGLLTVTIMGIVMANQSRIDVNHIIEFKENLQILLLSSLFILLAGRLQSEDLQVIGWETVLFVVIIIVVERPLAVWISAYGSNLNWREKLFIAWMAPRGIVAASVSSIFALELLERPGFEGAELIVPVTFSVIIGTVLFYSLTSGIVARRLGLAQENPQGVLIVGAHSWARKIALELQAAGFRVIVADTNHVNIDRAESAGLRVYYGNVLSERAEEEIDLSGIGRMISLTNNDDVNALASLHYRETFGRNETYQLVPQSESIENDEEAPSQRLAGRYLFGPKVTFDHLNLRFGTGADLRAIRIKNVRECETALFDVILPLFLVSGNGNNTLTVWTSNTPPRLQSGQILIGLVDPGKADMLGDQDMSLPVVWGNVSRQVLDSDVIRLDPTESG